MCHHLFTATDCRPSPHPGPAEARQSAPLLAAQGRRETRPASRNDRRGKRRRHGAGAPCAPPTTHQPDSGWAGFDPRTSRRMGTFAEEVGRLRQTAHEATVLKRTVGVLHTDTKVLEGKVRDLTAMNTSLGEGVRDLTAMNKLLLRLLEHVDPLALANAHLAAAAAPRAGTEV